MSDFTDTPYTIILTLLFTCSTSHRVAQDDRTWRERLNAAHANWKEQMSLLTEAYLAFRHPIEGKEDVRKVDLTGTIRVLDFYTLQNEVEYSVRAGQRTSEALVTAGYLPNSPTSPSIAISIKTLELLRSLRLFKASFSTEAFTKLICHSYLVSNYTCIYTSLNLIRYRFHIDDTIGRPLRTASTSIFKSYKLSISGLWKRSGAGTQIGAR